MTPQQNNCRTTDTGLVKRVRDWQDADAWARFVKQ